MSTTTAFVCGELNEFIVRKVAHKYLIDAAPVGLNTEERALTDSQVILELLTVKPITARLPIPSDTMVIKSLVYSYPVVGQVSPLKEEIIRETEEILGVRPVLPQPGLIEAPITLLPVPVPKERIIPEIFAELKKIAVAVFVSPESLSSKTDLAGTFHTISLLMRHLSLSELEQLEQMVITEYKSGSKTIERIFYDVLAAVGTNPSTMLVIKKVKAGELPTPILVKLVSLTIRSVRYPTEALIRELIKMVKLETVQANKPLFATSLLQLSNLLYNAYINPETMFNTFPTKLYGIFGTNRSTILTEEYIPFLVEKLERPETTYVQLVAITSLGKLGHINVLKPLLMVPEKHRPLAILSLRRLVKLNPSVARPILLTIISNTAESPDVRIAAVSVLPFAEPTVPELQKLAIRSWYEPSMQVSSFIYTTLKSLAYTVVPELRTVGLKAKTVLPLMKPITFGIQHSHNIDFSSIIEYMKTIVSQHIMVVNSKETVIPRYMSLKTNYYGPSCATKVTGMSFLAYINGMEVVLEKFLYELGSLSTEAAPAIVHQLEKIAEELKLKTRELNVTEAFVLGSYSGMETALYLDSNIVLDTLEKVSQLYKVGEPIEFSHISAIKIVEANNFGVTETGLPIVTNAVLPYMYAIKGSIRTEPIEGQVIPKITAKIIPVFNAKLQSVIGVISPFTKELIGTGVEMSIHSSVPVEVDAIIRRGEVELALRTPKETARIVGHPLETLHAFVLPYTVRQPLFAVLPLSRSTSLKPILSGIKRQPVSYNFFPIFNSVLHKHNIMCL